LPIIEKIGVDQNTILIGHSIGCAFILSVLEKYPAKAAFLIGGFTGKLNIEYDKINKTFAEKEFDWQTIMNNCKIFGIFNSDNDPYVPLEKGKELAKHLNTPITIVKAAGHFRKADHYTTFPLLLETITSIV